MIFVILTLGSKIVSRGQEQENNQRHHFRFPMLPVKCQIIISATESPRLFCDSTKYPRYLIGYGRIGGSLAGIVWFFRPRIPRTVMAVSVALTSGRTIRWRKRRFVVVDKRVSNSIAGRLESATSHGSPLVKPGQTMQPAGALRLQPTLCPWMKRSGRLLSKRFSILKPLFETDKAQRTRSHVEKVARILDRHPATIYRWIDAHDHSERVFVLLRKGVVRSGRK